MAPNPLNSGPCAHCAKPATKKCGGCLTSPSYNRDDPRPTFYCSAECQKSGWKDHKAECTRRQLRKSLARAAELLKDILYRIQLHATILRIKRLEVNGSTVTIYNAEVDQNAPYWLVPLDVPGEVDQTVYDAIVMHCACQDALAYLPEFMFSLLKDLSSDIEACLVIIKNRKILLRDILPCGRPDPTIETHYIFKVTLTSGESWALDPTGAQFGFREPLLPWDEYVTARVSEIVYERALVKDGDYENSWIKLEEVGIPGSSWVLAGLLNNLIPSLALEQEGVLSRLLEGSDEAFVSAKERFLRIVEDVVKFGMSRIRDKPINRLEGY
ncbi:hypothetical protein VTO42DRAFT_1503 [Malbranchea cinnamomea]